MRCRFTDETHAAYRDREASLAMIQRTIEAGGYLCECPGWWGCSVRGCYEAAKANYRASRSVSRCPETLTT
jgi:hypothetical protein